MRRSDAHEYRQAYNAQAVVCADGAQLILTTNLIATTADAPSFVATILAMLTTIGLLQRVLADAGYASGPAMAALQAQGGGGGGGGYRTPDRHRAHSIASALRFPAAARTETGTGAQGALADHHEGKVGDQRC